MRALVTGATGMLGSYVARRLLEQGWEVRALCRRPEAARRLGELGVEVVPGDLVDPRSLEAATGSCQAVVHAAAAVGSRGTPDRFRAVNVEGTRSIIAAAAEAGARLVQVSTTAVFGGARYATAPTGEDVPLPRLPDRDVYGRTKQEAERLVLDAHRNGTAWATVVRPTVMYGVGDRQFAPRIGPLLAKGVFPIIDGGRARLTLVHADAVACGIVRALGTEAAGGRVYHLTTDFDLTVADLVRYAAEGLGRRIRTIDTPLPIARAGFMALRLALAATGRGDLALHAKGTLDMLTRDNPFSCERARSELGWDPVVRPAQGVPEAFRWWRAQSSRSRSVEP